MSKTANVTPNADSDKEKKSVFQCQVSDEFMRHVNVWCSERDVTAASVYRAAIAEYTGYAGEVVSLVDRKAAAVEAGKKRKATMGATKAKASVLDMVREALAAKLAAGEEVSTAELLALLTQ